MRIGLIGCGRWGKLVLRDLIALGCTVEVVARSAESIGRAREGGASSIVASISALGDVAGVIVATPTSSHAEATADALSLGVPVFVEKPLTDDPVTATALAEFAPHRLFVMDKWRYHPGVEEIGAIARSGEFGALRALHTRRLGWGQGHDDVDSIWVLLPHDLSIMLEIVGSVPDPVGASGYLGEGQNAALTGLLGPQPACVVHVSSLSPVRERQILATFDEAVVWLDDPYTSHLRVKYMDGGEPESRKISEEMPLLAELGAFLDFLDGGPPPRSSAGDAAMIVNRIAELRSMAGLHPDRAPV